MSIIDQYSPNIPHGLKNMAMKSYITMPSASYPLTNLATFHDFSQYKNTATEYTMMKLDPITITQDHLANADIAMGGDYRPVKLKLSSVSATMTVHPATITISALLQDQSILSFDLISAKYLARYSQDVGEIKCGEMLLSKSINYSCKYGTNGKSPTEASVKDLNAVSSDFRNAGMNPLLAQYIAGIAIGTSGIPKAYALVGSPDSIQSLLEGIGATTLNSYKAAWEYSGATNYSHDLRGIEQSSAIAFISSNNFRGAVGDGVHSCVVFSADSYMMSSSTPTSDALIGRDSLISSPTGLKTDYSTICPLIMCILRAEGIRSFKFTDK